MKKLTTLVAALAITSASFAVFADCQNNYNKSEGSSHHSHDKCDKKCHHKKMDKKHQNLSPEQRQAKMEKRINFKVERMTKKLNLTENQQNELKSIFVKRAEKKLELYKETKQQIKDILNPEQVEKMEQFKKGHKS